MKFVLLPVIEIMLDVYTKPRTPERFREYLATLQGATDNDLAMPLMGYNPMAKEHAIEQLKKLKDITAETVITRTLDELNTALTADEITGTLRLALNLSDDLMGGWTNRYTSDYDSKFRINALIARKFCTPILWTSEVLTTELVQQRTSEYAYRTIYWLHHKKPRTLAKHIAQESYVAAKTSTHDIPTEVAALHAHYLKHKDTTDYSIIFNFLYGDAASQSLGYPAYGVAESEAGYKYARYLAGL